MHKAGVFAAGPLALVLWTAAILLLLIRHKDFWNMQGGA